MTMRAIEWWAAACLDGNVEARGNVLKGMVQEQPMLLSILFERTCNLSCRHCIYPDAKSSANASREARLHDTVVSTARQMPEGADMIHVGRIFRHEHLQTLMAVREARPDMGVGMIDNGSFTSHLSFIKSHQFQFTWIDLSVDGDERTHNTQRRSGTAYRMARAGIARAHEVADKVTSLMTLTSLNAASVGGVGRELVVPGEVDELHFTPMTPYRSVNKPIEMSVEDFRQVFCQIAELSSLVPGKIFLRLYRVEDLAKLGDALGPERVYEAFDHGLVDHGRMIAFLDGVEVTFYPYSIWPQEEVVIDADGRYRFAGSGQYSLDEYREGKGEDGANVDHLQGGQHTPTSNLGALYRDAARKWWLFHGRRHLEQEARELARLRG